MKLERLQELARPLGWKIVKHDFRCGYYAHYSNGEAAWHGSLTPIRTRLEAEYRKLAEQAQHCLDVCQANKGYSGREQSQQWTELTRIAAELAVKEPKGPTMVESIVIPQHVIDEMVKNIEAMDRAYEDERREFDRKWVTLKDMVFGAIERKEKG